MVVGNPPYITVKDKAVNESYREAYDDLPPASTRSRCRSRERFFELATQATATASGAGYVGQITANSFMKREFGKKLIEEFFPTWWTLPHVIDTSGAYIPGHGTPTVILFGRNAVPAGGHAVRAVLGHPR